MSRLPFELLLALRYLRPKRTFVSVITLISVLGVTLGVAVLIIVIGVMSGFDHQLQEKVFGFNAHLTIFQYNTNGDVVPMTNAADVIKVVQSNPKVTAASPLVLWQVVMESEPDSGRPSLRVPYLRGIDPGAEKSLGLFTNIPPPGSADLGGRGLLVGIDLAEQMRLNVGDHVALSNPEDILKMQETRANGHDVVVPPTDFEVRGIFDAGFYEYNSTFVITSIENAQDLLKLGDSVQGVLVMLRDPFQASAVREELMRALKGNYGIMTWERNSSGMSAVAVEKNVMFYIMFFIVIVAAFGITCTLITFVVLKTREIGILKALGAGNHQVLWIFMSQSMVVSFFGVMTGTITGLVALHYRNEFLEFMRRMTGIQLFPADIYNFSQLPALILPSDIMIICGGSFIICLLAAAFPAWNASRLKPVEALRHE